MMTKSKFAFLCSCSALEPSRKGHLYMWTYTFAQAIDVSDARKRWSKFLNVLRQRKKRKGRIFDGVRVFELHPGGHGLHVHCVTSRFLHVNEVRALWNDCGGGRVHVMFIPPDRAGYLGKYLRKQGRPACFKGVAMWQRFGGFKGTKICDVVVDSTWKRIYGFLRATVKTACGKSFDSLQWHERQQAVANVERFRPWWWALGRFRPMAESVHDPDGGCFWEPSESSRNLNLEVSPVALCYGIPD